MQNNINKHYIIKTKDNRKALFKKNYLLFTFSRYECLFRLTCLLCDAIDHFLSSYFK